MTKQTSHSDMMLFIRRLLHIWIYIFFLNYSTPKAYLSVFITLFQSAVNFLFVTWQIFFFNFLFAVLFRKGIKL